MQVRHGFAGIGSIVKDQSITGLAQPEPFGHLRRFEQQPAQDLLIFGGGLGDSRDWLFGNEQDVGGRLGLNVPKGEHLVILINNRRWNLAGNDFFEKGLAHEAELAAGIDGRQFQESAEPLLVLGVWTVWTGLDQLPFGAA